MTTRICRENELYSNAYLALEEIYDDKTIKRKAKGQALFELSKFITKLIFRLEKKR